MSEESDEVTDSLETVLSGGVLVFGGKILALGFGFLTQLVMARLLSTSAYGNVILTIAVVNIFWTFSKVGVDEGMNRKVPEFKGSTAEFRGVIKAGLLIPGSLAIFSSLLLFLLAPAISNRLFDDTNLIVLLRVGSLAIPLGVVTVVSTSIARGVLSAKPHTYVNQVIRPAGRFVFIGGLVAIGYQTVGAIVGHVLSYVAALAVALWFLYRKVPNPLKKSKPMYRDLLIFSLPLTVVHGMNFLIGNVDTFLLGYYLTSSEVGIYNIAFQLRNLLNVVLVTIGFLVPPVLATLETERQYKQLRDIYQFVTKWVVFLTFPLFVSFLFLPDLWIGSLFGNKYLLGTMSLFILGIGVFFSASVGVSGSSLVALGKNRIVMYTTAVSVAVNILFNILLIPRFGMEGAALGSTLSVVVLETLNVSVLYRQFSIFPISVRNLIPIAIAAIIATGLIEARVLEFPNLVLFVGWSISYAVLLVPVISEQDITISRMMINK